MGTNEIPVDGPLVHWKKVQILKTVMVSLHRSSAIASDEYKKGGPNHKMVEGVLTANSDALLKAVGLINIATAELPEQWKMWPSLN